MSEAGKGHPVTPDGRYFVVHGRLSQIANPGLPEEQRQRLVGELMSARRAVRTALRADEADGSCLRPRRR